MAVNMRFSLRPDNPDEMGFPGSYPNGSRGNFPSASFDRSGSFQDGSESLRLVSGASTARASSLAGDGTSLVHFLLLDPIPIGDQRYTRFGELRRILAVSHDAEHSSAMAVDELKRFRASILDGKSKARGRIKKFDECMLQLEKYEASCSKKVQRNGITTNERSGGSSILKMGIQNHRKPLDIGTQRLEEKTKSGVLNKRARSSAAELRADGRSSTIPRPRITPKDKDVMDYGEGSDQAEEKIRILPVGGEGWDKKMKRKRSVSTVCTRPVDTDGDIKRLTNHKLNNETGLQSFETQGLRSGSLNASSNVNKFDDISSPPSSNSGGILKSESDKAAWMRDVSASMNKERPIPNGKLTIPEESDVVSPSPVKKGRGSRTPRTGSVSVNAFHYLSRTSGGLDGLEQLPSAISPGLMGVSNSRKRSYTTGPSSSPMAQWVGQRLQKSRSRRANVVSPVSNSEEVQISSDGGNPSDFGARVAINGPLFSRDIANGGSPQARVKDDNTSSPVRFSESEESGGGENNGSRSREKGVGVEERSLNQNVIPSVVLTKKSRTINKDDNGDGSWGRGRTGRGALPSRPSSSQVGNELQNSPVIKPRKNSRALSDENGRKSGRRPFKKVSDRKAFGRHGLTAMGGSADITGEADDDHEDILAAANLAVNSSYLSCCGSFWKRMEPVFAPICLEDSSFLEKQLESAVELNESLSGMLGSENMKLDNLAQREGLHSQHISKVSNSSFPGHDRLEMLGSIVDLVDQGQDDRTFRRRSKSQGGGTPLFQRVLAALIEEDESEGFEESNGGRNNSSFKYNRDDSPSSDGLPIDFESNGDCTDFRYDSLLGCQDSVLSSVCGFPWNGTAEKNIAICNGNSLPMAHGLMHANVGTLIGHLEANNYQKPAVDTNVVGGSDLDCPYEKMCLNDKLLMELQSIGIYPEVVPDLADGDDESLNEEIVELQKMLYQQADKKTTHLDKLMKALEEGRKKEKANLDQVAMDRMVELAFKKQLATKGSSASKLGIPKVSKPAAQSFMKRTLARCRRYDKTGTSCFNEPAIRDVLFAVPHRRKDGELTSSNPSSQLERGASGSLPSQVNFHGDMDSLGGTLAHSGDQDFARTGPISNRGKKKEVLLDDVGGNDSFVATFSRGKRSDREKEKDSSASAKPGRGSTSNVRTDARAKPKARHKTGLRSVSEEENVDKSKETGSNKKEDVGLDTLDPLKESKETSDMMDLKDFSRWFDEEGLSDDELPMEGLETPMDNLDDLMLM